MNRYLLLSLFILGLSLIARVVLGDCPHICPGCQVGIPYLEEDPELGTITKECASARCDLTPWCFEVKVYANTWKPFWMPWKYKGHLVMEERVEVTESNGTFLTGPYITASVTNGEATVCISRNFEWAIPIGDAGGNASVISVTVGGIEPKACLGSCPCSGGSRPSVTLTKGKTEAHHRIHILVHAWDVDGDLACVGYNDKGLSHGKIIQSEVPEITALRLVGNCEDELVYESSTSEPGSDVIWAWAKDGKGHIRWSNPLGLEPPNCSPKVDPHSSDISRKGGGGPYAGGRGLHAVLVAWDEEPPCFKFSDPDGDVLSFSQAMQKGAIIASQSFTNRPLT